MNRTLVVLALVASLASYTKGFSPEALDEYPVVVDGASDGPDARLFFVTTNTTTVTVGYTTFILGVTSIIVLGVLVALAYFYATGDDFENYGSSGYSSNRRSGSKAYVI